MNEHTPGPWNFTLVSKIGITPAIVDKSGNELAILLNVKCMEENKFLITAAPELLETCKEVKEEIEDTIIYINGLGYDAGLDNSLTLLEQAIAKAEGK